jgi:hypothetical protein
MSNPAQLLITSTDIKQWGELDNFLKCFANTPKVSCVSKTVEELENFIYSVNEPKTPTIIEMTVGQYNKLTNMSCTSEGIQVLFGMNTREKLLHVEHMRSHVYLQGIWYLFLSDLQFNLVKFHNNENDRIFVGAGFVSEDNGRYLHSWGYRLSKGNSPDDQNVILFSDGIMVYRLNKLLMS